MSHLKKHFSKEIKKELQEKYSYKNIHEIPSLRKVVISMGVAEAVNDKGILQDAVRELTLISGQKPIITKAKKSISNFKLRKDYPIGAKVTLRQNRMYDFFERFCNFVCPRIPDFRGFDVKGDGRGNLTIGLDDQQIFPEINLDQVKRVQGMHVTFVTSAQTDKECVELLRLMGLPFKNMPVKIAV